MAQLLLINGPNLNLLGRREPERYGAVGLPQIVARLEQRAEAQGHLLAAFQSNAEHVTHTSIGLLDALLAVARPFIEIHLTNIHAREPFRRHSYLSDAALGVICGLGDQGYDLALEAAMQRLGAAASNN